MRTSRIIFMWLGALASAALCGLIISSGSASQQIGLGLQNYARASATVTISNLSDSKVDYVLKVERKIGDTWPKYQHGMPFGTDSGQPGSLGPGQSLTSTLPVMVYAPPTPWRVSIFCQWSAPGPNTTRFKAGLWLLRLRMQRLARKAFGEPRIVQISGLQMDQ